MMIVPMIHGKCVSLALAILVLLVPPALAVGVPEPIADGDSIWGDWQLTLNADADKTSAILSFSEDESGKLLGKWLDRRGVCNLADLEYANYQLSFKRIDRFGDSEKLASFTGTAERETLVGILAEVRGQSKVAGKWIRPMPRIVGTWEGITMLDGRQSPASLVISADKAGVLSARWKSPSGEDSVSELEFISPKLTFKRTGKTGDAQWESAFQGIVRGDALSGAFKGGPGRGSFQANRLGAAEIGKWLLQFDTQSGPRTQILTVRPDLTALYGPAPAENMEIKDNNVSFQATAEVDNKVLKVRISGRIQDKKLLGEITGFPGAQKVEGVKLPSPPRRNLAALAKLEPLRQPDVAYVPTPQPIVDKMLELAAVTKDDLIYDLGCGDGRIVVTAALRFGCRGAGFDISPDRVRDSLANVENNKVGNLVTIEEKDVFGLDLSPASVITLYLLPELNAKLIPQLEALKPGSRIVSHDFNMPGVTPDKVLRLKDKTGPTGEHTLYLWITPLKQVPVDSPGK
jgi:hypothetical protein